MRGYPRNRLTDRSGSDPVITMSAESRGHRISFEEAGAGPAIMLVPGWTMSAADWRDAGYIDRLATSHCVLAVDPLGNGVSVDEAPTFAALHRLASRTWLANDATNTYGGVYLFEDRDAVDAYLGSDLFRSFATDPSLPNLTAAAFEILDAPGAITHDLTAPNPVAV